MHNIILTVGSCSGESVLTTPGDIRIGDKHRIERHELLGGSGLNYALRLLRAGFPALPLLSVGDDRLGHFIQQELLQACADEAFPEPLRQLIARQDFFSRHIVTPHTTIIVSKDTRTILSEKIQGVAYFKQLVERRLTAIGEFPELRVGAVMIGHIYSDHPDVSPGAAGGITRSLIETYSGRALIYANLGASQLSLGADFWEPYLPMVDVFQLSLGEVRTFFRNHPAVRSLADIIHWFRERHITAVITLDKFGAIATYRDGAEGVIFDWPFDLESVVDSTGAGDAFAAGFTATLFEHPGEQFPGFLRSIQAASIWGAYACTSLGGAQDCPDRDTLARFSAKIINRKFAQVEVKNLTDADLILKLLDKAY